MSWSLHFPLGALNSQLRLTVAGVRDHLGADSLWGAQWAVVAPVHFRNHGTPDSNRTYTSSLSELYADGLQT